MKKKVVFVADIADDIDDLIAIEFLARNEMLECLVLDGKSNNPERENKLKNLGVIFKDEIPEGTDIIFCGGALTKIAKFVRNNKLELLVANGGFAGSNIVERDYILEKFRNKEKVRTYNFNLDLNSTIEVLESTNIKEVILVSKNVCHNLKNTKNIIHNDKFLDDYELRDSKCLHDLLMVKEGVSYINNEPMFCDYKKVNLIKERKSIDNMTLWGSELNSNSNIKISINFKF